MVHYQDHFHFETDLDDNSLTSFEPSERICLVIREAVDLPYEGSEQEKLENSKRLSK